MQCMSNADVGVPRLCLDCMRKTPFFDLCSGSLCSRTGNLWPICVSVGVFHVHSGGGRQCACLAWTDVSWTHGSLPAVLAEAQRGCCPPFTSGRLEKDLGAPLVSGGPEPLKSASRGWGSRGSCVCWQRSGHARARRLGISQTRARRKDSGTADSAFCPRAEWRLLSTSSAKQKPRLRKPAESLRPERPLSRVQRQGPELFFY